MSGEVLGLLAQLEYSLRSNTKEKITSEEELVFRNLKDKLVDISLTSSVVSSLLTWKATKYHGLAPRLVYSTCAAAIGGLWGVRWASRTCLDPILAADGSRMQEELAAIMLAKHQRDPFRPTFISRHLYKFFYPEEVYSDSCPDISVVRWRLRNSFNDISGDMLNPVMDNSHRTMDKPVNTNRDVKSEIGGIMADPLDCLFSDAEESDVINDDSGVVQSKRISRSRRRAQRRHRARERAQQLDATSELKGTSTAFD